MNTLHYGSGWTTSFSDGIIHPIQIEVILRSGLPRLDIIGLPQNTVREGKDRIASALHQLGITLKQRVLINLYPSDLPKEGSHFDLPILMAILRAQGLLAPNSEDYAWGELALDGHIRPTPHLLAHILGSHFSQGSFYFSGKKSDLLFLQNHIQNRLYGISHIRELLAPAEQIAMTQEQYETENIELQLKKWIDSTPKESKWNKLRGNQQQFDFFGMASIGRQHLLIEGSPGVGKTFWSLAYRDIQRPITLAELRKRCQFHPESADDYRFNGLNALTPYEAPHHSSSGASIIGGGSRRGNAGSLSKAHLGTLFLDEIPEYSRDILESLREPLENKIISIGRSEKTIILPADIQLIGTFNPCPCGNYNSKKICSCSSNQFYSYQRRLSQPLRDRFHYHVWWKLQPEEIKSPSLSDMRYRITEAAKLQPTLHHKLKYPKLLNLRKEKQWLENLISWAKWNGITEISESDQHQFESFNTAIRGDLHES